MTLLIVVTIFVRFLPGNFLHVLFSKWHCMALLAGHFSGSLICPSRFHLRPVIVFDSGYVFVFSYSFSFLIL